MMPRVINRDELTVAGVHSCPGSGVVKRKEKKNLFAFLAAITSGCQEEEANLLPPLDGRDCLQYLSQA